jgi:hypothetical protein
LGGISVPCVAVISLEMGLVGNLVLESSPAGLQLALICCMCMVQVLLGIVRTSVWALYEHVYAGCLGLVFKIMMLVVLDLF